MGLQFGKSRGAISNSSRSTNILTAGCEVSLKSTSTQYPGPCVIRSTDASLTIQFRGTNINLLGNALCECDSALTDTAVEPSITSLSSSFAMIAELEDPEHPSELAIRRGPPVPAPTHIPTGTLDLASHAPSIPSRSLAASPKNSTFEQTAHPVFLNSQPSRSFPSGTIAALVLAGVIAIFIILVVSYYFLRYRPNHLRKQRCNALTTRRRGDMEEQEPKNDVLDISADAIARQRELDSAEMRQWVEAAEGRNNGWTALNRLGLTFKKSTSSSSPGEDRASGASASECSSSPRGDSVSKSGGRGNLIWKRSWGSSSRRCPQVPSQTIELGFTRSISTAEDDKVLGDPSDTDSLRFAPIHNGIPSSYNPPRPIPHPYTNTLIPKVAIHPPTAPSTPQSPFAPIHEFAGGLRPSSQATDTSSRRADFRSSRHDGSERLSGTAGSFTSVVRSLSPRTSEVIPRFLQSSAGGSDEDGSSIGHHQPLDTHTPLPVENQESVSTEAKRLSVHFREGTSQGDGASEGSRVLPQLHTLSLPAVPRSNSSPATPNPRDKVTSFLDLDSSSKEGSVQEQNNSSPTSLRHPQPPLAPTSPQPKGSVARSELSLQEPKSGWISSTPSTSSQPSPVAEPFRWSESTGIPLPTRHLVESAEISSPAPSSVFPYPVSLPPSPYHPEHLRSQSLAALPSAEQSPFTLIPSDVPRHHSLTMSTSSTSPRHSAQMSEIQFRNPDDITDVADASSVSSNVPPNSRPPISASDSYIVQRVLGRPNPNLPLTPIGRGVDIIP